VGYTTNSGQGVWALTETGAQLAEADMDAVRQQIAVYYRAAKRANKAAISDATDADAEGPGDGESDAGGATPRDPSPSSWRAGRPSVPGAPGLPTYFQCKRYAGSVGAGAVRDFRGAMAGRGEKGVIITTATFTPAARDEATRDGVPPIDLVDGDQLCDLLKRHGVGVRVTERVVEDIALDETWWAQQA
jgi:restriction system protein